jgi:hypothetical protein
LPAARSLGQDLPVRRRTVVPLARADVAARSVEVDMERPGGLLAHLACDAREIRVGSTRPIVTLGMTRVVSQRRQRPVVLKENDQFDHRVDQADGRFPVTFLSRTGRETGPQDLAVGALDPPVRSHPVDNPLSQTNVRHRLGLLDSSRHSLGRIVDHTSGVLDVEHRPALTPLGQHGLGAEIQTRCVVLVDGMDRHVTHRGTRCLGQLLAELPLAIVADTDPIDAAEDDRLLSPQDHQAAATERHDDLFHRIIGQRTADGRCRVDLEMSHPNPLGRMPRDDDRQYHTPSGEPRKRFAVHDTTPFLPPHATLSHRGRGDIGQLFLSFADPSWGLSCNRRLPKVRMTERIVTRSFGRENAGSRRFE